MADESSFTPKLYLSAATNNNFIDLSGAVPFELVIQVGRLPQKGPHLELNQPIIVPRKDTVLDAYHCLKKGILRFQEIDQSKEEDELPIFSISLDHDPQCSDFEIEIKPGGQGPGCINKVIYQRITYPVPIESLRDFRPNAIYRLVYNLNDTDRGTGLNWWRKSGSDDIKITAVPVRFIKGLTFKVLDRAELPPAFNFEIGIKPDLLSLSKPVPITISVKITLVDDDPCTVENKETNTGVGNIFAEALIGFNLIVVEVTTDNILSYHRRAEFITKRSKAVIGYKQSEFRQFQPRETVEIRREIPVEDIERFFRDSLNVSSLESLKSQSLELKLRKSGLSTIPGMAGDEVAIWWTRKSIDELFGGKDVVYSVGDKTFMRKIILPSDTSTPFSVTE